MEAILYLVIPCYNDQDVLPETALQLKKKMNQLIGKGAVHPESKILFVNDGSKDHTWDLISQLHAQDTIFGGINLTRNRRHQNALLAGLMVAKDRADLVISMDADLQDDIDAVDAMVEKYHEGCDIVYGVRSSRKKDTFFKRFTAEGFYRVMNLFGVETVFNHADYRLMSKRALEGITSLSTKPIQFITGLGFLVFMVSMAMLLYSVVRWAMGATILGWASLICSIWAIGGLILLSLGVIGEYIGKIYLEAKARPRYLIKEILEDRNG